MKKDSDKGIQVISRASAILREVVANSDGMSLGQLATATGLARSTVQRIVDALEIECLVQAGAGGVRPGWGLRRLGDLAGPSIASQLRPQLRASFHNLPNLFLPKNYLFKTFNNVTFVFNIS